MNETIIELGKKMDWLRRSNQVLQTCLEAYQTGLIRPKAEVLYYAEAVNAVDGGMIKLAVPADMVGRKFKVILEAENE